MKIQQCQYRNGEWKVSSFTEGFDEQKAQLVLVFGERSLITNSDLYDDLAGFFPAAILVSCSTAGEIGNDEVKESTMGTGT